MWFSAVFNAKSMVICGTLQYKYEHIELASLQLILYVCAKTIVSKEYNFIFHINHPILAS